MATNWIQLGERDVLDALNNAELTAYRGVALANPDDDPLSGTLEAVTSDVRAACGKRNRVNATGIPKSLKTAALDIAVYRLAMRVSPALAEKRKPANDKAEEKLDQVREGDRSIEKPDHAASQTFSGQAFEQSGALDRRFTRSKTDGL